MSLSLEDLSARAEITDLTIRYARLMDLRDWTGLRQVFAPQVHIDFHEATGAPPGDVTADAVVAALRGMLDRDGLVVQTLTSNALVEAAAHEGRAVVDYHVIHHARSGEEFGLRGRYTFDVSERDGDWRIARLVVGVSWTYGSPAVLGIG